MVDDIKWIFCIADRSDEAVERTKKIGLNTISVTGPWKQTRKVEFPSTFNKNAQILLTNIPQFIRKILMHLWTPNYQSFDTLCPSKECMSFPVVRFQSFTFAAHTCDDDDAIFTPPPTHPPPQTPDQLLWYKPFCRQIRWPPTVRLDWIAEYLRFLSTPHGYTEGAFSGAGKQISHPCGCEKYPNIFSGARPIPFNRHKGHGSQNPNTERQAQHRKEMVFVQCYKPWRCCQRNQIRGS